MILTLVARDISGVVVARADLGDANRGKEQSKIFISMAEQYMIKAERVDPYNDDVTTMQADFAIDVQGLPEFFELCKEKAPIALEAVDILKVWGRQPNIQWRIQHKPYAL